MKFVTERTERAAVGTIYQVFVELDSHLAQRDPEFRYDVEAGLARLKNSIARLEARRPGRGSDELGSPAYTSVSTDQTSALTSWLAGSHGSQIHRYLQALNVAGLRITSANSPEFAVRIADGIRGERWRLSWLPDRALSLAQAISAMVLDEILIAHELDSATMLAVMGELAADLSMPLTQALSQLASIKKWRQSHAATGLSTSTPSAAGNARRSVEHEAPDSIRELHPPCVPAQMRPSPMAT